MGFKSAYEIHKNMYPTSTNGLTVIVYKLRAMKEEGFLVFLEMYKCWSHDF